MSSIKNVFEKYSLGRLMVFTIILIAVSPQLAIGSLSKADLIELRQAADALIQDVDVNYTVKNIYEGIPPEGVALHQQIRYAWAGDHRKVWEKSSLVESNASPMTDHGVCAFNGKTTWSFSETLETGHIQEGPTVGTSARGRTHYQAYTGLQNAPETEEYIDLNTVQYLLKDNVKIDPEMHSINGISCYRVYEGTDDFVFSERFLAPELGYATIRSTLYDRGVILFFEVECSDYTEVAPSIQLPMNIEAKQYHQDGDLFCTQLIEVAPVRGLRVNTGLEESFFEPDFPVGIYVQDLGNGTSYQVEAD